MFWADELARRLPPDRPQVVNDSKTPSGMVPISGLRGPILHDAICRALRDAGVEVRYRFGIDAMDPMDSQSMRSDEALAPHMGKPLFAIPASEAGAPSFADLHANRFLATFADLGIHPELYRTDELYRQGRFDRSIDLVLRNADKVRQILRRVANVDHGQDYHALNVVCERCGRIGTTRVSAYDGQSVTYECRPDLVTWAAGCGNRAKTSPFGGNAKLPYVEEWCAKWDLLGVTVEGCGKDLATAGGARDRSDALYREVWGKEPPLNVPYEFLTVAGKKMSTSHAALWRDLGAAAHEIVGLLTGEIVRFLMLRPRPNTHIEFDPSGGRIPKLFYEYDEAGKAYEADPAGDLGRSYALSQLSTDVRAGFRVRFSLLANWLQIPSIDPRSAAAELVGRPPTEWEERELARRGAVVRTWLDRWAPDEARFSVTASLPASAGALSEQQRELLRRLSGVLSDGLSAEELEARLYAIGRELGLSSKETFAAVYLAFIGKPYGPRAAWLLAALDRDFARRRLEEAAAASPASPDAARRRASGPPSGLGPRS